ncbi:MAG TPA: DUF4870 domain-containing protein [Rugosimonospora sp.]|nr:DUF4870 domain-containing protein [Rugosimonospora sp.]
MTQPPNQYPPGPPNPDVPPEQGGYPPPPQSGYPPPAPPPGYPPTGGGYPPSGGGYPPPAPGYPPAPPPPGYASNDEKTWALVSHFGGAGGTLLCGGLLGFVPALIAYLTKGKESPTIRAHSTAALNFFIPLAGVALVLLVLRVCNGFINLGVLGTLIGLVLLLAEVAVWVGGVVIGIVAGMKANEGTLYKYPVSYPIIK